MTHTAENIPGTKYQYNGFLFGGLSVIVDNVSKKNFITLMQGEIINKLKMSHSSVDFDNVTDSSLKKFLSTPYEEDDEELHAAFYPQPHKLNAAAGFLSCVKDLAKFDIALDLDKMMSPESKKQGMTPFQFPDGRTSPYGLGWFITTSKGQTIVYHYGLQESYSAIYLKIPAKKLTLIMLCNSSLLTMRYHKDLSQGVIDSNPYINEFLKLFL